MANPKTLKIATWNIGGGILGESHQRDGTPMLDHHVSVLEEHGPDVVFLQEAHERPAPREGQVEHLARNAGYPHFASFPVSESHLEKNSSLALGVLSRFPISTAAYRRFPSFRLEAAGPHGTPWKLHDKGYVAGTIDLGSHPLGFLNAHCFPLHRFGHSPTEPRFAAMWEMLSAELLALCDAGPAVAAFDLNHEPVEEVLGEVLGPGRYTNSFTGTTTPGGAQRDYILHSPGVTTRAATVLDTGSDHSYCHVLADIRTATRAAGRFTLPAAPRP
ncbi:endonuclease/exonuclease/phosphatase family protein [Lentzea sp. JNUCC 0626]|uniref:endonuclease/exonuclease/phosphatase family protein n=1 Tax=Lentzea sp. JNUCC 0626 TaxID=3367513 RepID=UPI003747EE33